MNFGSEKPIFLYFKGAGRATPARVALFNAFGEHGWENRMLDFSDFSAEKKKWQTAVDNPPAGAAGASSTQKASDDEVDDAPRAPADGDDVEGAATTKMMKTPADRFGGSQLQTVLGYLPQLHIAGMVITQSPAIARFAARMGEKPLMPKDPLDALQVEEVMMVCEEVLAKAPSDPDNEKKLRLRHEFSMGPMMRSMKFLEERVAKHDGYAFGGKFSIADVSILTVTDMVASGEFDGIPPSYLDQFDELARHQATVPKKVTLLTEYRKIYPY